MTKKYGGVDRSHDSSRKQKIVFAFSHGVIVIACFWLALGGIEWADQSRTVILACAAAVYFLRHLITLFVLLRRKVDFSESLGLTLFFAVFEIGFLLLGAGVLSGQATPFSYWDVFGIVLLFLGSFLNTGSELQRSAWKKLPNSKGRCYTGGLFSYSMHVNYLGDSILFTGWAILAASVWAFAIPVLMIYLFVFHHIPSLDKYLAERYGDEFQHYAARTAKFIPFVY